MNILAAAMVYVAFWTTGRVGVEIHQDYFSPRITSQQQLKKVVKESKKELGLEKLTIGVDFDDALGLYFHALGMTNKIALSQYHILIDPDKGNYVDVVRHELCHIKHGDTEKSYGGFLGQQRYELWDHFRTYLCGAGWMD